MAQAHDYPVGCGLDLSSATRTPRFGFSRLESARSQPWGRIGFHSVGQTRRQRAARRSCRGAGRFTL